MKRVFVVVVVALLLSLIPQTVSAQAIASSKLVWDQPNAADAPTAQAYTFRYYPDGALTGTTLATVTCTGTTTVTCTVAFPAFTPGSHTLALTAANTAGESAKSAPFAFTFVVVPGIPVNIRIQ